MSPYTLPLVEHSEKKSYAVIFILGFFLLQEALWQSFCGGSESETTPLSGRRGNRRSVKWKFHKYTTAWHPWWIQGRGGGCTPPFSAAPVNGAVAPIKSSTDGGRLPPVLMHQSHSDNEKNVHILGSFPSDPHRSYALWTPNWTSPKIYSVMSTTGLQCNVSFVVWEEGLFKRKDKAA